MSGAFEIATRAAIEELIQEHAEQSRFGFILTPDGFRSLTDSLYDLLMTSRNLKSAGDRFMAAQAGAAARGRATIPANPGRPKK